MDGRSIGSGSQDIVWSSSDTDIATVEPVQDVPAGIQSQCKVTAISSGTVTITASVTVQRDTYVEFSFMPAASLWYKDTTVKYTGETTSSFSQGNYYTVAWMEDPADHKNKYMWKEVTYDGPSPYTYSDTYDLTVKTFVRIDPNVAKRLCLYKSLSISATSPTTPITWSTNSTFIEFEGGVTTGSPIAVKGVHTGSLTIEAKVVADGVYSDSMPLEIYAIDVKPDVLKMIVGQTKTVKIASNDIFYDVDDPDKVVDWVTSAPAIATVEENPTPGLGYMFAADVTANATGSAYITALAEDPATGDSYSDAVRLTVGYVAINAPDSPVIDLLLNDGHTLGLTANAATGYSIDGATGWSSSNPTVATVTIDPNDHTKCTVTGLTAGVTVITVTASDGTTPDTDTIAIEVTDVNLVTMSEMRSFTNGLYDGHGKVDWEASGEEDCPEVPDDAPIDVVTEEEATDMIEGLFPVDSEEGSTEPEETSEEPEEPGE